MGEWKIGKGEGNKRVIYQFSLNLGRGREKGEKQQLHLQIEPGSWKETARDRECKLLTKVGLARV